ncbi:MAG TPA: glycosyltransferase [Candidatus Coprenecus stercoravium]|uniref:Glycosyltransferase n=1 Tax=Candidatus Coprenecus stercoravium TaxID=2840735 RepID=A0A9D2GQM6_9BACT|nr:glycosyltransferase [Candidatus Coprenecus stercoravium]
MKVLMVADARSVHTRRWAVALKDKGIDVMLYSIFPSQDSFFQEHSIKLYVFDLFTYKSMSGLKSRISWLARHRDAVRNLKSVIACESPDILHAHYATSSGLISALTGFHPFIISVWGSDVYEFPYQSLINRLTVKYIFKSADRVLSTSHIMARQAMLFTSKTILVTPFGVDIGLFRKINGGTKHPFVIGNVKALSGKYGIDVLIRSFRLIRDKNPGLDCRLVIVGDGPCGDEYRRLVSELGMDDYVTFTGRVPNDKLPEYYNSFSVAVSLSDSESFGVVAVEAMACECPVIVSDADGFKEVVEDGVTGFIVPRRNPEAAAYAVQKFIDNPELAAKMGKAGRERVCGLYNWDDNVTSMIGIYSGIYDGGRS